MSHNPIVRVREVVQRWEHVTAVDRVSLDVCGGEFAGLVGPNGAGKTTLLRVIAGLLPPSDGGVWLDHRPLGSLSRRALARSVAVVPQDASGDIRFSAHDVVMMGRYAHRRRFEPERASDRAAVERAMALTGLTAFADRPVAELSGGERQRVIVARALAQTPRVLLLDEPTTHLDLKHQIETLELVRRLVRDEGLAAVAAIHDLELASRYCTGLVLLDHGRVVAEGPPEAVLTPRRIRDVFGVTATVSRREETGGLAITVLGSAEEVAAP
ncbi:MAG: ABC transporter ATP-binding protein [Candidatus Rokubacteria bacterium]|nr:ABC transporter ATP-binding protein [Candidatus Rokubacteria bacterium]